MKKSIMIAMMAAIITVSFSSCRDTTTQTREEVLIDDMTDQGADIKVKRSDDGDKKIKMETDDKKVKIKTVDGKTKIKEKDKN